MKYFIGIVPPEDLSKQIADIQNRFGSNRLEPHITLVPPEEKQNEKPWLQQVQEIAASTSPFTISLSKTGFFRKDVLFLSVESQPLEALHERLKNEISWHGNSNNITYRPHLTLGRKWCGFTDNDFAQMQMLANEMIEKNECIFTAHALRVYHKPFVNKGYIILADFILGGKTKPPQN